MKAIDKIKDGVDEEPVKTVKLTILEQFNGFCKGFGGSTQVEGLRIYGAFNHLIIGALTCKALSLETNDIRLMEDIESGWELGLFEDDCFDDDWYLHLFMKFDSDSVVRFFINWDEDDVYLYDMIEYWCCDEVGKTVIDMYAYEELDFNSCRGVVQRCRIAGNLNLKVWLDKFEDAMAVRGDSLPDAWWKSYGFHE